MKLEKKVVEIPLGITFNTSHQFFGALGYSVQYSWSFINSTFQSIGEMIAGRIRPQEGLSGPVGIVQSISTVVTTNRLHVADKLMVLLRLFGFISLSIGLFNLFPIPLLDGNQLLLLVVEAIRRKRLSLKAQQVTSMIGIILLVSLFAFGLYADVIRLLKG